MAIVKSPSTTTALLPPRAAAPALPNGHLVANDERADDDQTVTPMDRSVLRISMSSRSTLGSDSAEASSPNFNKTPLR